MVKYKIGPERMIYALTDQKIIEELHQLQKEKTLSEKDIMQISRKFCQQKLSFTFEKVTSDPNEILKEGKADCIGYSALFTVVTNYLLEQQGYASSTRCRHAVGKLYVFGIDVHQYFKNPFFKDHHFNMIHNQETEESTFVDASLYDYFGIKTVSRK